MLKNHFPCRVPFVAMSGIPVTVAHSHDAALSPLLQILSEGFFQSLFKIIYPVCAFLMFIRARKRMNNARERSDKEPNPSTHWCAVACPPRNPCAGSRPTNCVCADDRYSAAFPGQDEVRSRCLVKSSEKLVDVFFWNAALFGVNNESPSRVLFRKVAEIP